MQMQFRQQQAQMQAQLRAAQAQTQAATQAAQQAAQQAQQQVMVCPALKVGSGCQGVMWGSGGQVGPDSSRLWYAWPSKRALGVRGAVGIWPSGARQQQVMASLALKAGPAPVG